MRAFAWPVSRATRSSESSESSTWAPFPCSAEPHASTHCIEK